MHLFPHKAKKVTGFYQCKHMPFNSKEFCKILCKTKESLCLNLCLWVVTAFLNFFSRVYLVFSDFYLSVEDSFCVWVSYSVYFKFKTSFKKPHRVTNKKLQSGKETTWKKKKLSLPWSISFHLSNFGYRPKHLLSRTSMVMVFVFCF